MLPGTICHVFNDEDAARLGRALEARRLQLRLTQAELAERIGVSIKTVNNVARGATIPQKLRRQDWEVALGWGEGSIKAVLAGGEPTVTGENPRPLPEVAQQPVGLGLDAAADGLTPEEIEPVLAVVRAIKRAKGLDT